MAAPVRRRARPVRNVAGSYLGRPQVFNFGEPECHQSCAECVRLELAHPSFAQVLDALRHADDQAVAYSDVLGYVDRENELAEDL